MRIKCILCVRRKKCSDSLKEELSLIKKCDAKVFRIRADK